MTPVEFHIITALGDPVANALIEVFLPYGATSDNIDGVVMPNKLFVETDVNGEATLSLMALPTRYVVVVRDGSMGPEEGLFYQIIVPTLTPPSTSVRFQDILIEGQMSNTTYDEAALLVIHGAKASATASQVAAAASQVAAAASQVIVEGLASTLTADINAVEAATAAALAAQGAVSAAQAAAEAAAVTATAGASAASASQTAAAGSATAASTSAGTASTAATTASGAATTASAAAVQAVASEEGAVTAENNAAASAAAAAASLASVGAEATAAAGSATAAAASALASSGSAAASQAEAVTASAAAVAAGLSEVDAEAAATAAGASQTAAAGSATAASGSATAASASAAAAVVSKDAAAASATAALASETASAGSATAASGSATAASGSATAASGSATAASGSATAAAGSATTASTAATNAGASATAADASADAALVSETAAAGSASAASASATAASGSATAASGSATAASGSATAASGSATAAAGSATAAEAALDSFTDIYLGSKTTAPSLDNDGNALATGALYYDSVLDGLYVYTGAGWGPTYSVGSVDSVAGRTGAVVLAKADVGLANVDNTTDANKPVSTATQTALDGKQATLVSATNIKTVGGVSILGAGDLSLPSAEVSLAGAEVLTNKTINGSNNTITNVSLTAAVTGTLPLANGGTGQTSAQAALNALAGGVTAARLLRGDGTNVSLAQVDLTTDVTGTLPVTKGGTGVATLSGVVFGNTTGAFSAATAAEIVAAIGVTPVANATAAATATSATSATSATTAGHATTADTAYAVTNGVYTSGAYNNPAWITGLDYGKLTGTIPTWNQNTTGNAATATLAAATTNGLVSTDAYNDPTWLTGVNYSKLVGTVPTWNQHTTGSAAFLTTSRSFAISGPITGTATGFDGTANITIPVTALDVGHANVTGVLGVTHGGTGISTYGTDGQVLTSAGAGLPPTWEDPTGGSGLSAETLFHMLSF